MVFGVIFDMDGVLVDSSEAHLRAWSTLGRELAVPFSGEVFEQTFGMHNHQILPLWLGDELPQEEIERLARRKEELYRELAQGKLEPLAGVVDLIEALARDDVLLAVGSSGPRANVEMVLDGLGVRPHFRALATGDEVRRGKPDPEVFLRAAAGLDLAPERCVVVEDAPQGVRAAVAAGSRVVAVTSTRPAGELADADLVVDSLAALDPARLRALVAGA